MTTAITDLPMVPLKVVGVEAQPLVRGHLAGLLNAMAGVEVVAACENGIAAVAQTPAVSSDLALLDIQMPAMPAST